MGRTVEKTRNANTMSESAFRGMIRSSLRQTSRRRKPIAKAKEQARRKNIGPNKRLKYQYKCSLCNKRWSDKEIEVDHIVPAGTLKCAKDLPLFVENLFCETEGLRVLCKECHKGITDAQKKK